MASIPKRVSDRLAKQTRKFQKVLKRAKDRDINESDTVVIVADMLADLFGFDKYTEITSEYSIKGTYCDLAVKVGGNVQFLIEAKAIGLELKDPHIRQAVSYGSQHGIQWVILTNGVEWEIYNIKFEKPVTHELLTRISFLDLNSRKKDDLERLYLLCKEGLSKAVIDDYLTHVKSVNKFVIGAILQTDNALNLIRREVRRVEPGIKVDIDEIEKILLTEVLKRDVMEGDASEDAKARVKKASGRKLSKPRRKRKPKTEPKLEQIPTEEANPTETPQNETSWPGSTY